VTTLHHQAELIGPYVLGVLDEAEALEVEEHTASCEECSRELEELRDMEASLAAAPPELFLDGPPDDADLLLQRTLRQVRTERATVRRRRSFAVGMAAAASAAIVFFGGFLTAGGDTTDNQAGARPSAPAAPATPSAPPAGIVARSATDASTKAAMTLRITPAAGWVRLSAAVTGVPAGEHCRLVVLSKDGHTEIAGSWLVGDDGKGGGKGAEVDGSASIAPDDVKSVTVQSDQGEKYVTVPV
jgi:hypothetical protein